LCCFEDTAWGEVTTISRNEPMIGEPVRFDVSERSRIYKRKLTCSIQGTVHAGHSVRVPSTEIEKSQCHRCRVGQLQRWRRRLVIKRGIEFASTKAKGQKVVAF
jgi:hypothetical protein